MVLNCPSHGPTYYRGDMSDNINWKSEWIAIKDLKEFEYNPRRMSKKDFERLVRDLQQDGYHNRIIVNQDNTIIGGHSRKKALLSAGYKLSDQIEVLKPDRQLTEEEFKRINVKDNLPFGEFDFDILANHFDPIELVEWGMPSEWLVGKEEENKEIIDDFKRSIANPGETWILGSHRLICGDSHDCDLIIKYWEKETGNKAILEENSG